MKEYNFKINGNDYEVSIKSVEDGCAAVTVNGAEFEVEFQSEGSTKKSNKLVQVAPDPKASATPKPSVAKPVAASSASAIKSPLPGVILEIKVSAGDSIKVGQRLLVLEAMKMENNIDSDRDGVVKSVNIQRGDSVLEGDVLITIE